MSPRKIVTFFSIPLFLVVNLNGVFSRNAAACAEGLEEASLDLNLEQLLGRSVTENQRIAVSEALRVGNGEPGRDGFPAIPGNYTTSQLARKAGILRQAGFNFQDLQKLMPVVRR